MRGKRCFLALMSAVMARPAFGGYTFNVLNSPKGVADQVYGDLVLSGDTLYGTTSLAGTYGNGSLFSLPAAGGTPTVLTSFNGTNGTLPNPALVFSGGTFYGTAQSSVGFPPNVTYGEVFSVPASGGTPTLLTTFNNANGNEPIGGLALSNGILYGTTQLGGDSGQGVIFSIPVSGGSPTVLASLNAATGYEPQGRLTASGNTLYGKTLLGGENSQGVLFSEPMSGGIPTVLASFNSTFWSDSFSGLIISGNALYGVGNGSTGYGQIFSMPLGGGAISTVASFNISNGEDPGSLIKCGGTFYGTTNAGGANGDGTIFSVPVTGGTPEALFSFNSADGLQPANDLTCSGYTLYGTTQFGGANNHGTIFSLTPTTLTWNNSGAASPSDGKSWDVGGNNNFNDGANPISYSDPSAVIFNDNNNGNYAVTLNATVTPASVTVNATGNYTISGTGSIAGIGSLTQSGSGTLTLATPNTYSGGTNVSAGTLVIEPTGPTTSALPAGALTIRGGEVELATNVTLGSQTAATPSSNVNLTSLSISGNGTLDVSNNHFIINYSGGADPIATIAGYLSTGYAGGAWNGIGVDSSTAAVNARYGAACADGADGVVTNLPSGEIEIAYALYGDINLDGVVNGNDFAILAAHFGETVTGGWDQGDLNYDGTVNGNDFALLAENFGKTASGSAIALPASQWAALDAFAAEHGLMADVPEPGCAGLALLLGAVLLGKRRRED
jgi:autotransporter-associated beta strand protein/uncharacterized repeat protein (TIGR03803 family)